MIEEVDLFPTFRFETQEDTGKHLQELQNRAEKEIRDLGAVKEKLEAEWELVKFMGQEENTELREKLEVLEEDIMDQQVHKLNHTVTDSFSKLFFRFGRRVQMRNCSCSTSCWLASSLV